MYNNPFDEQKERSELENLILNVIEVNIEKIAGWIEEVHPKGGNAELEESLREIERLKDIISAEEGTISNLNEKITEHELEVKTLKADLEAMKKKYDDEEKSHEKNKDELKKFKDSFDKPLKLYNEYKSLDSDFKERLSTIICHKDVMGFISSCSGFNNLESLWDYIKTMLMSDSPDMEKIGMLMRIFDYFFDLCGSSAEKPTYKRCEVVIGERYDDDKHIRGKGSSPQGHIETVQLLGYQSVNTGKICRKSIVIAR